MPVLDPSKIQFNFGSKPLSGNVLTKSRTMKKIDMPDESSLPNSPVHAWRKGGKSAMNEIPKCTSPKVIKAKNKAEKFIATLEQELSDGSSISQDSSSISRVSERNIKDVGLRT
jgi:hypothetical protein